ncbi:MAG: DUF1403 family protein [Pseudomonadota bacterium]
MMRLAISASERLAWSEGLHLRPEKLALVLYDRIGGSEDDGRALARAAWSVRRMTSPIGAVSTPSDLGDFLETRRNGSPERDERPDFSSAPTPEDLSDWCTAMGSAKHLHPLVQAAMAWHLWRAWCLTDADQRLEASVVAGRLAAHQQSVFFCLPVDPETGPGTDAPARLTRWLQAALTETNQSLAAIARVQEWRHRAFDATGKLQGKGAPALVDLIAGLPVVSAKVIAHELSISTTQARHLIGRFEALDLVREMTGHSRFRFWTART